MGESNIEEFDFGDIKDDSRGGHSKFYGVITGIPKNQPNFVMHYHSKKWDEYWFAYAKLSKIEYHSDQRTMVKNVHGFSEERVLAEKEKLKIILEKYDEKAKRYNKDISEPFFRVEDSILEGIVGINVDVGNN